jgi:hypothetical protein
LSLKSLAGIVCAVTATVVTPGVQYHMATVGNQGDPSMTREVIEASLIPLVRGQLFLARFAWLKDSHGSEALRRVLSELADDEQRSIQSVEKSGWYPWLTFVHLDEAIARLFAAPGDPSIYQLLGAASASRRTEWLGDDAALVSVHSFLARVAEEHRLFQNFGHAEYRRKGFNQATLEFSDYPSASRVFCWSAQGFLRAAVELLAQSVASVEEQTCQTRAERACRFWIRWEPRR